MSSFARGAKKYVVDVDEPMLRRCNQEVPFDENCYWDWSSTNPEHSSMIVDITFFIEEYGYGDIQLCLMFRLFGIGVREIYPDSQLFYVPEESATAFRNVRKVGQCHAQFVINNLQTDGTSYRFWPAAKTDFDDNGRMIVAMRKKGGNPNVEGERGAPVICLMRPFPQRVRRVEN